MKQELNKQKLLELSEKALSIEEEILKEEKSYQEALIHGFAVTFLISIREKIRGLYRKESLFNGAIEMRLRECS